VLGLRNRGTLRKKGKRRSGFEEKGNTTRGGGGKKGGARGKIHGKAEYSPPEPPTGGGGGKGRKSFLGKARGEPPGVEVWNRYRKKVFLTKPP